MPSSTASMAPKRQPILRLMEIKISNKTENKLLDRTEIEAEIINDKAATPKRNEVRKLLAAQLGADEQLLIIKKIAQSFGSAVKLSAMLYKTKEELQKYEPKYMIGRETGQKKKPGKTAQEKK